MNAKPAALKIMEERHIILKRAKNALITRDFDLASQLYGSLLEKEPENRELLAILGNLYIKAGKEETAETFFKKILELSPGNVDALNSLGGICRRTCRYDEAIAYLQQALATDQKTDAIEYNLGFTYKSMGRIEDAINCFQSVITANPTDALAYNHLGVIYAAQKNYEKAVACYRRGLQVDPNNPILQYNLAKSYEATGNYTNAISAYEIALRAKPGWSDAVKAYTEILLGQNRTGTASELVRNALSIQPGSADFHCLLGRIFTRQDNYESAASSLETAERFDPSSIETLSALAEVYEKDGRAAEAAEKILAAEKMDPDSTELLMKVIGIMISAGKMEACGNRLQKLRETLPHDARVHDLTGQYYICTKREAAALRLYEQIEQNTPRYTDHLFNAARRYAQMEHFEEAQKYVKAFIRKNSDDVGAWLLLGKIDETLGNLEEALRDYETAARVDQNNQGAKTGSERLHSHFAAEREREAQAALKQAEAEWFDKYAIETDAENGDEKANYIIEESHSESPESGAFAPQKKAAENQTHRKAANGSVIPPEKERGSVFSALPDEPERDADDRSTAHDAAGMVDGLSAVPAMDTNARPAEDAAIDAGAWTADDALISSEPPTVDALGAEEDTGNIFPDIPDGAERDAGNRATVSDAAGMVDGISAAPASDADSRTAEGWTTGDALLSSEPPTMDALGAEEDDGNMFPDLPDETERDADDRSAASYTANILDSIPAAPASDADSQTAEDAAIDADSRTTDDALLSSELPTADALGMEEDTGNIFPDFPDESERAESGLSAARDAAVMVDGIPAVPASDADSRTAEDAAIDVDDALLAYEPPTADAPGAEADTGNVFPDFPDGSECDTGDRSAAHDDSGMIDGIPAAPASDTEDRIVEKTAIDADDALLSSKPLAADALGAETDTGNIFPDIPDESERDTSASSAAHDQTAMIDSIPAAPASDADSRTTDDALLSSKPSAAEDAAIDADSRTAGDALLSSELPTAAALGMEEDTGNIFPDFPDEAGRDAEDRSVVHDAAGMGDGIPAVPASDADADARTADDALLSSGPSAADALGAKEDTGNVFPDLPDESERDADDCSAAYDAAGMVDDTPAAPASGVDARPAVEAAIDTGDTFLSSDPSPADALGAEEDTGTIFSDVPDESEHAAGDRSAAGGDSGMVDGLPAAPASDAEARPADDALLASALPDAAVSVAPSPVPLDAPERNRNIPVQAPPLYCLPPDYGAQTQQLNDMLKKVNANAEQVMNAAEKTLHAAEILADAAHNIEAHEKTGESERAAENLLPQNPSADSGKATEEASASGAGGANAELLEQIAQMLPVIRRLLENKDDARKYEHEIMLFKRLRSLGEHLPEYKRDAFLSGKTRLLLDYLIARLSGKPGLLMTIKALRKTDALGALIEETERETDGIAGRKLALKVLGDLCALLPSLQDQTLAQALLREWQAVKRKI